MPAHPLHNNKDSQHRTLDEVVAAAVAVQEVEEVEEAPASQFVRLSNTVQRRDARSPVLSRNTNVKQQQQQQPLEPLQRVPSFQMPRKSPEEEAGEEVWEEGEGEVGAEGKGTAVVWLQVDWTGIQLRGGLNRK